MIANTIYYYLRSRSSKTGERFDCKRACDIVAADWRQDGNAATGSLGTPTQ
jgi:hypothetical protein